MEWEQKVGTEAATLEKNATKPFEKKQWILRQQNKFGRSLDEAETAWARYEASPMVQRDNLGWKGCVRLWLDGGEKLENQKKRFVSGTAVEGSDRRKKARLSDRDAFRMHALEADSSFSHEFFQGRSTLEAAGDDEDSGNDPPDANPKPSPSQSAGSCARGMADTADGKGDDPNRVAMKLELDDDDDSEGPGKGGRARRASAVNVIASRTAWFTKSRKDLVP